MSLRTPICDLLGIEYPIFAAGMGGVTMAPLAEKVPLLASGLGTLAWMIEACHRAGTKVLSLVGSARQARKVEAAGVDIIAAQGIEAGDHVGGITTMLLVPAVVDAVSVPVLAAGGITDGRGIAAGMVLGAQGAWIGTRFIATPEATAHANHKRRILEVDEDGTVVSRCYTGKTSRVLKNEFTERWKGRDAELMPMPWQRMRVESLVAPAKAAGLLDVANFPTGQGAGAIRDMLPAHELFMRMLGEARKALGR